MSDFTSNFWSVFVTTLTLVGILACALLLWMAGRKKVAATADNTPGHVWDEDLVEMNNPRDVVPESNMPAYPWLDKNQVESGVMATRMKALRTVGVPYTDEQIAGAEAQVKGKTEQDALIAYLQIMGRALK